MSSQEYSRKARQKSRQNGEIDVRVSNEGIFMFEPVTEAAKDWVTEHVELDSWQWLGNRFAVADQRMAEYLTEGMINDGLIVE